MELEYWLNRDFKFFNHPECRSVETMDRKAAQVVLLRAPATSIPGTDFSMAFLRIDGRVIDWASCWTCNRAAGQDLQLEDVDGDGFLDLAFRASPGCWGLLDPRQHSLSGRNWLYAYAITGNGFESLFPSKDGDFQLEVSYDKANQPVELSVSNLPQTLREHHLIECTLTATNRSEQDLALDPDKWFGLIVDKASYSMHYMHPVDKRDILKPGDSITQTMRLRFEGTGEKLSLRWVFVPRGSVPPGATQKQ